MNNKNKICVVHYDNLKHYDVLALVTDKTKRKILKAKIEHEKLKDEHLTVCQNIPVDLDITELWYHKTPCYKRFTRVVSEKSRQHITPQVKLSKRKRTTTRSSGKSLLEGLTPTKRPRLSFTSPPSDQKTRLRSSSTNSISSSSSISIISPTLSSRSQFIFGINCVICKQYILRYNRKKFYPQPVTLLEAAEKIKESAKKKEKYSSLFTEICDKDLIAAEFKCHNRCRIELIRPEKLLPLNVQEQNIGNFKELTNYIDYHILQMNQVLCMDAALNIYTKDFNTPDIDLPATIRKRRSRLKEKLLNYYGNAIFILSTKSDLPNIIINALNFENLVTVKSNENETIENAASFLRQSIKEFSKKRSKKLIPWPPSVEDLKFDAPPPVILFLTKLLKSPKHSLAENTRRLVESFAFDLIHGVTKGDIMTTKHYLLGLGFHNIAGKKNLVQILHRLGHSISYDHILDIETAQAKKAQQTINNSETCILPLVPNSDASSVTTVFWVDNLDKNVETERGGGAINMTTMMAFQENSDEAFANKLKTQVEKSRKRILIEDFEQDHIAIETKKEPPSLPFAKDEHIVNHEKQDTFNRRYFSWMLLRLSNAYSQRYPTFPAFLLKMRMKTVNKEEINKTVETYLPPLKTKVTEGKTIYTYMSFLQKLASQVNMKYTCITLDVGAAMNAYKVLWSHQEQFPNVVIHLGDFHYMKENFKVLGNLVRGSGFEDVIFQSGVCTSGSLAGLLTGGQYNRAWNVHKKYAEGMERLSFGRFKQEKKLQLSEEINDLTAEEVEFVSLESLECTSLLANEYEKYKMTVRDGHLGKTAQYWMMYMDIMKLQHQAHTAVQENDFDLRLKTYKEILPLYFYYSLQNYARYGSYYVETLQHIDSMYPGLKVVLNSVGMSVQGQDRYPLRTSIDQRGEQTINRDAKTSGGIGNFAHSSSSVMKWCLNRSEAAKAVGELKELAGLSGPTTISKELRPMQIIKSENDVTSIENVIKNEYLNPFGFMEDCEKEKLYNLSSGVPIDNKIADEMLQMFSIGKKLYNNFRDERLTSKEILFHSPIKQNKYASFAKTSMTATIKSKDGKIKLVEVNRSILSALNSYSLKSGTAIDYNKALRYPLSPVPLSISNADGTRRFTAKSKLKEILLPHVTDNYEINLANEILLVDTMAVINLMIKIPSTYFELARKFLSLIPKSYRQVDIIADNYKNSANSIKRGERIKRGESEQIQIASLQSKVPGDFRTRILRNSLNKARVIELIFEYIKLEKHKCLKQLDCNVIVISVEDECTKFTYDNQHTVLPLETTQEEADTKLILHANYYLETTMSNVTLYSPSGDTDVVVLAIALLKLYNERVTIIDGHGKFKKTFKLNQVDLDDTVVNALIGFHAFSGNDFVSSFFRKGKKKCYEVLEKKSMYQDAFALLGNTFDLSDSTLKVIQQFVCQIYNSKKQEVNEARYELFHKKYQNYDKAVDMSTLPPCLDVLNLHILRSQYIAALWKRALISKPELPNMIDFGWNHDGTIKWVEEMYPLEVIDILFDDLYEDENCVDEGEGESDEEF